MMRHTAHKELVMITWNLGAEPASDQTCIIPKVAQRNIQFTVMLIKS